MLNGCKAIATNSDLKNLNSVTNEKSLVMVGYQPIDPIQIVIDGDTNHINTSELLASFPNEATRLAIGEVNQKGSISFRPFSYAKAGKSYSIILDYIKYTTSNLPALYKEFRSNKTYGDSSILIIQQLIKTNFGEVAGASTEYLGKSTSSLPGDEQNITNNIKLPVYVGIGLRIQASITVLSDSVNLSSLFGIGLAASQNKLNGSLIIQTLGITGENISPLMPMPNEINESTIQAAMQAVATIKSKIYDASKTIISPQIVAFKIPFAIEGANNLIEATLQTNPPKIVVEKGKIEIIPPASLKE
jgi:hypothetical protein